MTALPPYLEDDPAALAALSHVEVLYTDLDGTLLSRGGRLLADASGAPSALTAQAIVELNRSGLAVVPVSGRMRIQLTETCRLVGWSDFIAEVGAVIVRNLGTKDRTTEYNVGDWSAEALEDGQTPLDVIDAWGAFEALAAEFPGRIEPHAPWHTGREATHLLRGCLDVAAGKRVLDDLGAPVDLIDNGQIHPPIHTLACTDHIHAYHLVPRGVSKAQAIALDLAERGLAPEQAMAVGDSAADLGMAESVGLVAMVENALDSPFTLAALEKEPRARLLRGARGEGWAELARLWMNARS